MSKTYSLASLRDSIKDSGLEEQFLKASGLDSMDLLDPKYLSDVTTQEPPIVMKPSASAAPIRPADAPKSIGDASTGFKPMAASDMFKPYIGHKIMYASRKNTSSYCPSALMMDYILHQINNQLTDNFYFKRACPDYHPYILRLYYGILFWVQCLRAGHHAAGLPFDAYGTLIRFGANFPPETLPISSPLLGIFKSLCCSQPEIPCYGKVYPALPTHPGPERRDAFMLDGRRHYILPNIPGIVALLDDLNKKMNPADPNQAVYPAKGRHIPVTNTRTDATIFGHHTFPALGQRQNPDRWALVSSGLQYPCEADRRLNESFAERYGQFEFPITAADDDLSDMLSYLHMTNSPNWFAQVRDVAAAEASFFEGSGTLADCSPVGIASNQIVVEYQATTTALNHPTQSCDPGALFDFSIRSRTSARSLPELAEAIAATSQTNIEMPPNHPFLSGVGLANREGAFWQIRPEEVSSVDENSYLSIREIIRGLMKPKG